MNSILDLNGEWELLWDTEDVGITNRWYATYPEGGEHVQVPHVWENSFEKLSLTQDTAYYFKRFFVDEKQIPKRIFLNFERIATHATVWLNGKLIGEHFGAYSPFTLDTSKAIKLGEENVLCLRVANMGSANSRIDFGRETKEGSGNRYAHPSEMPVGLPWTNYPFGGIYGNVSLTLGNAAFISGVELEPDMDQERVGVEVSFNNPRGFQTRLRILMRHPSGTISQMYKELKLEKENATHRFILGIKDWNRQKCVWTLDKPNLFTIELQLEGKTGKSKDKSPSDNSFSVVKTFGFRKFDCIKGDFYMNDAIVKLQGICYSQHCSSGGLWNANKKLLEKDFKAIKEAGFNAIRSGGAPLTTAALEICDRLGFFVFQELPIHTMRSTPRGLEKAKEVIEEVIKEQRHHPCIAAWILGAENGTLVLENGNKLLKHADQFDMSRPMISNLNSVYLDNEENFRKDAGKLMGVTNDRVLLYASHRMHLRMAPSANLSYFLAHYCDKEDSEISVPDTTLGDMVFQDDYQEFVRETNGKILVTVKNHSLLPDSPTAITGLRSAKNLKAIKQLYKQLSSFVSNEKLSIWKDLKSLIADATPIALKSKIDQITALQSNPLVAGYFLDQWADLGVDFSGIVDENRNSKKLGDFLKQISVPTRLLLCGWDSVAAVQSEITFQLSLLNAARLEKIEIEINIEKDGKVISSQKKEAKGQTSLTQLGVYSIMAPKEAGAYQLVLKLNHEGKTIYSTAETLRVIEPVNVKAAMKQVCFLDNNAETTSDALAALGGKENIIFTASLNSWNDEILARIVEVTKAGKTLLLSDMNREDIEMFNASHHFDSTIESLFTTGANDLSLHYLTEKSPLLPVFGDKQVLDSLASAVMPSVSLNEIEGAEVFARSVSIAKGEVKTGVDLQSLPYGKGKIVFNQFSIFEGLETNPLADAVFAQIVEMIS
ncbi:MAG: beta-galactosidase [Fibrobacter sp.]|jgi:hypothetical protein|nr:beta-galactosidase [Fibrobacter sp.]